MVATARLAPKRLLEDRAKIRAFAKATSGVITAIDPIVGEKVWWPYQDFCRGLPSCVVWGCCCRYHPKALPLEATHCSTMWSGRDSHLPSFLRQGCTCKKVSLLARPILTCCS